MYPVFYMFQLRFTSVLHVFNLRPTCVSPAIRPIGRSFAVRAAFRLCDLCVKGEEGKGGGGKEEGGKRFTLVLDLPHI